jgi:hypothetical protein
MGGRCVGEKVSPEMRDFIVPDLTFPAYEPFSHDVQYLARNYRQPCKREKKYAEGTFSALGHDARL